MNELCHGRGNLARPARAFPESFSFVGVRRGGPHTDAWQCRAIVRDAPAESVCNAGILPAIFVAHTEIPKRQRDAGATNRLLSFVVGA